jgi:hypothetical protein
MSWTGWLVIASVTIAWLAFQFAPEWLNAFGISLDRLSPKVGLAILVIAVFGIVLAATMFPAGGMKN